MDSLVDASTGAIVTEKLVAALWDRQRPIVSPLVTADGDEIQVVYRGRRRWDRGPDFTGALIAWPGGRLLGGDVEIHVRSTDWRAHGHHRDRHYNRVVLQVVMWHDSPEPSLRQDGVRVPVLALAPRLSVPLESLLQLPSGPEPMPSPCWRGSLEFDGQLGELLDRCGRRRFAAKAAGLESDLTWASPDQLLYRGIAVALGYRQNREPFRRLAERLPLEVVLAYRAATGVRGGVSIGSRGEGLQTQDPVCPPVEALLLGAAGLLPSQRGLDIAEQDPYAWMLEEYWSRDAVLWAVDPMDAAEWEFFRVRPSNFPTRRLAALAKLVDRWPRDGLAESLAELVRTVEPKLLPRALEALLLGDQPEGYWAYHCDFGRPLRRPGHSIGRQRAAEVVVNAFLPFLAAWASRRGDEELAQRVSEVYLHYPKRGDNEISRYAATQITGCPRPRVARSACRQQGLLHLYWSNCEAKRCRECPIVS